MPDAAMSSLAGLRRRAWAVLEAVQHHDRALQEHRVDRQERATEDAKPCPLRARGDQGHDDRRGAEYGGDATLAPAAVETGFDLSRTGFQPRSWRMSRVPGEIRVAVRSGPPPGTIVEMKRETESAPAL